MPCPSPSGKKAALINLGCAKNLVDSEVMLGYLRGAGYGFVRSPEDADVVVVNTCGFIRPARDEADDVLRRLSRLKKRRPEKRIAVVGCYVRKDRDALRRKFPAIDVWLGVGSYDRIVAAVEGPSFREPERTFLYDHRSPRLLSTPAGWAYVKVSEGCSHRCAFCTIPSIKGPYRSRSVASIVAEAGSMAGRGIREIVLVSQDTTYYGRDRGVKDGAARLLSRLARVNGVEWVRMLYGYPDEITDALLEALTGDKVCPYLDIPFQHSDPVIVKRMKRGIDGARALKLIERIRKKVPGVALRTSLIVGFPGEGAKEFQGLMQFVREARFDHLGVFTYSAEAGTAAAALDDRLTAEEKERRKGEVMELQAGISRARNQAFVGRRMKALLEGSLAGGRGFTARIQTQAPEVDGVVLVDADPATLKPGEPFVEVEITGADAYDLKGRCIP
jgi:ribosomal protein S12 methylthiotransferase